MDNLSGLEEFIADSWSTILAEVHGAAVYIDDAAAECLHWFTTGEGYLTLKDAGAIVVHELGMYHFRYAEVRQTKKAVIISTSGDPAFYQRTIKMILTKNAFESFTIFNGAQSCLLDYAKLKRDVKDWIISNSKSQEPTVNVIHAPIFIALLSKDLFVTPTFGNLMPPVNGDITEEALAELDRFANSLHNLFEHINAKLDIYSIGKCSDRIAESLESLTTNVDRRNHHLSGDTETGVSLILIDRTLDLCTPTGNSTESFLAKIIRTLPRLPHHQNDVAISMSPILSGATDNLGPHEVPGCLASADKTMVDLLISEKPKKILIRANQALMDMLPDTFTKESPKPKTPTRISGHSLEKLLAKFGAMDSPVSMLLGAGELQSILAIVESSTSDKNGQIELLTSLEKLALQNLSVSRESSSILTQLSNVIRTRITRGLDMENLLALLIHVYALAGTEIRFSAQQERCLEEAVADAIYEDMTLFMKNGKSSLSSASSIYQRNFLFLGIEDNARAKETGTKIASRIIDILRTIAEQRSTLQDYRSLMIKPNTGDTSIRHVGLLEQLLTHIVRRDDIHDLRQRSNSLISAGFNLLLRGRAKRHPRDNPWILIYVVGGITAEEAKILRDVHRWAESSIHNDEPEGPRIMLAGSRLLNPLDVSDKILLSSIND